jgi:lysozyme
MRTSQNGIDMIKSFEALRLEPYKDSAGVWTCGYGFTGPEVKQGVAWTLKQAEDALQGRIGAIDGILKGCVVPLITQNQWDALVSLVYNIGQGAFRGSTLLRLLNQRDFKGAAEEFSKWDKEHRNGVLVEDPSLLKRREAERKLFLS